LGTARKHGLPVLFLLGFLTLRGSTGAAHVSLRFDQEEVTEHFRAAQDAMRAGRFDAAIDELKLVLRDDPGLVEARVNLGLAYHATGNYALAVAQLSEAVKQRPDLLPANLFLGLSYLKLGDTAKALPFLNRALKLDPSNREARRAAASAELSQDNYLDATHNFRYLFDTQSDKADGWFMLGRDYLQMGKRLTTNLSADFPNSAWSLRLAGDILMQRSAWNDADYAYRKALEADPAEPGLHAALGRALLHAGKTAEAESEFQQELSRRSLEPEGLLGMAEIGLVNGDAHAALANLEKIWRNTPARLGQHLDFPDTQLASGPARQMATEVRQFPIDPAREFLLTALCRAASDEACSADADKNFVESLKAAASARPQADSTSSADASARTACDRFQDNVCVALLLAEKRLSLADEMRLGRASFALGRDQEASDVFGAVLQQQKEDAEAAYWLTRAYLDLADNCFDELSAAFPDSWRAHELKGESLGIRQADEEAIAEFRQAARLHPDDPEIHEALGDLLLRQNELAEGESELETALRLNPSAPRSLYLLGNLYVVEREPAKGIPYLEAALRYDPSLIEARPALGKAYLKLGEPARAIPELERSSPIDRYGDLHYLLYEAYRDAGKPQLAAQALQRSQELRRKSAADDQAKIKPESEE
jgi:tetratricopeptide (TPR) repeat protein